MPKSRSIEKVNRGGIDLKKAEGIFDLMAKFAEYGFNKSHSAAYALVAYQTAYLKAHYPVEFLAALLTEDMANTDKVVKNINDCREMGIDVLPPEINLSDDSFSVRENSIRFGLGAVKGVGGAAIESILEARQEGAFKDLYDFCDRVDLRKVNKRVIEALIKCGAFTGTGANRCQLMAGLEDAMTLGQKLQQERESAQSSLFGAEEVVRTSSNGLISLPQIPEWDEKMLLGFEKETLGFFITGHPLQRYADTMRRFTTCPLSELADQPNKGEVRVSGVVSGIKETVTKKGDRMGFVTLEDLGGNAEIIVFPEVYAQSLELLKGEDPLLISGTVDVGEKGAKVLASEIVLLGEARERMTKRVLLRINAGETALERVEALKGLFDRHRGACETRLQVVIPNRSETTIKFPEDWRLSVSESMLHEARKLFGQEAVILE